ncbi:hypothetical protein DH2020_015123 [Rehmannia glutinosa]|uniref:PI31 proteasome regulator N-terminal domain-containing protein n=1 Tax=Rehmannia glutinosa TaxID=99300 RepID=A0ABR0WYE8_REHGL
MATEQSTMAVIRAARPSFRNRHDKVAFAIHAAFLSAGYILNSTGASAFSDDALSSSSADEVGIDNWNEVEDNYGFVYSNPEKGSKKVLMKCLVMNDKLLVDVLREGDSEPLHLEIDSETDIRDDRDRAVTGVADPEEPYISPPPSGYNVPPIPAFGGGDLFPGPGAGMYPTRGDFGGGSMLIGPQDPRFFGGRTEPGLPGGLPGVPPGARFDPYGPPGVPGFEPGRFVRNPRRPGGGTHPDLHHFPDGSDFI